MLGNVFFIDNDFRLPVNDQSHIYMYTQFLQQEFLFATRQGARLGYDLGFKLLLKNLSSFMSNFGTLKT